MSGIAFGLSTDDLGFLFAPHHHALAARVRSFSTAVDVDEDADVQVRTVDAVADLADAGLTAYCVPERYGGEAVGHPDAIDVRAVTLIREGLGWADGLIDTALAMQGLGSYPISLVGDEAQKRRYLPGLLDGTRLGAFAITEPEAGSDVAGMKCVARREGDHYVLDGRKTFISNAGVASQYVVFAKLDAEAGREAMTAFIIEPDDPGFEIDSDMQVMAPHPIGSLDFCGCRVPASRRLGEEGGGFVLAMQTLDTFRCTVGGAAVGMARRALGEAVGRSKARRQFGKPIAHHQIISAYLAEMATELDAARLLVYRAAHARDTSKARVSALVAMGKLYATEAAQRIIDRSVQIHGGFGVIRGIPVERLYREIRALRIYEGTSEIQKLVIANALLRGE